MYVTNCDDEENRKYESSSDLEANFAGYRFMGDIDWDSEGNNNEQLTSSELMRANEQGPFVPTSTDNEVYTFFNELDTQTQQPTRHDGIYYYPNQMEGYYFGQTETSEEIAMDCETDFIFQTNECQMTNNFGCTKSQCVAPATKEMKIPKKNWNVRDENTGKIRPPLLHEYLRKLLDDPNYSHVATYIDPQKGIFKFHDKDMAAKLWQEAKQRNCDSDMTYEKFARAIRHYYDKDIIQRYRAHFTFRFGPNSGFGTTWAAV